MFSFTPTFVLIKENVDSLRPSLYNLVRDKYNSYARVKQNDRCNVRKNDGLCEIYILETRRQKAFTRNDIRIEELFCILPKGPATLPLILLQSSSVPLVLCVVTVL